MVTVAGPAPVERPATTYTQALSAAGGVRPDDRSRACVDAVARLLTTAGTAGGSAEPGTGRATDPVLPAARTPSYE